MPFKVTILGLENGYKGALAKKHYPLVSIWIVTQIWTQFETHNGSQNFFHKSDSACGAGTFERGDPSCVKTSYSTKHPEDSSKRNVRCVTCTANTRRTFLCFFSIEVGKLTPSERH